MKLILVFLFAIGLANSSQLLEDSANNFLSAFESDVAENKTVDAVVRDTVIDALRKALQEAIKKIKVRVDDHHEKAKDLIDSATEIANRLKDMNANVGNKSIDLINRTKGKLFDILTKFTGKVFEDRRQKRDLKEYLLLAELESESLLKKVAEKINEQLTKSELVQYIKNHFAQAENAVKEETQRKLIEEIEKKSIDELQQVIFGLISKSLSAPENDNEIDDRSALRKFFDKLTNHVQSRYVEIYELLTNLWKKGLKKAIDKHQEFKFIAKETLNEIKTLHKETIREIIEILRPHKNEIGKLWVDLLAKARVLLGQKD